MDFYIFFKDFGYIKTLDLTTINPNYTFTFNINEATSFASDQDAIDYITATGAALVNSILPLEIANKNNLIIN